jgi:hypothetical protein
MTLLTEGRKLLETEVLEMSASKIISVSKYDDGFWIKFTMNAGNINVQSNKTLVVQPDGKTIKIED